MDGKMKTIAAVAVVAIIAIAAAAFIMTQDKGDNTESAKYNISFLVEDGEDYQWIDGSGDTAAEAAKDALNDAGIENNISDAGWVVTINNKGTITNPDGSYTYWLQFTWDEDSKKWIYDPAAGLGTIGEDVKHVCFLYGTTSATDFMPTSYPTHTPQ